MGHLDVGPFSLMAARSLEPRNIVYLSPTSSHSTVFHPQENSHHLDESNSLATDDAVLSNIDGGLSTDLQSSVLQSQGFYIRLGSAFDAVSLCF